MYRNGYWIVVRVLLTGLRPLLMINMPLGSSHAIPQNVNKTTCELNSSHEESPYWAPVSDIRVVMRMKELGCGMPAGCRNASSQVQVQFDSHSRRMRNVHSVLECVRPIGEHHSAVCGSERGAPHGLHDHTHRMVPVSCSSHVC